MSDRRKNAVLLLMLMMTAGMTFPASAKVTQTEVTATSESKTSDEPVVQETFEADEDETEPFYEAEPISDSASFSNEGNMQTSDRLDETNREFLTVTTRNGNIFYLVIDENADGKNVHFLNQVDEADLLPLLDEESQKAYEELKAEESNAAEPDIPVAEAPPAEEPQKEGIFSKLKPGTIIPLLIFVGALGMFLMDRFKKKKDDHHGEDPDGPDEEYEFEDDHEDEFTDDDDYEDMPDYDEPDVNHRGHHENGPKLWTANGDAQKLVNDFEKGKLKATTQEAGTAEEPEVIRLENVDAEEFFAGQNTGAGADNADAEDGANEEDFDDEDLGIDEEGVVDAQKALLAGIFGKNKKKRQENDQTAAQQAKVQNNIEANTGQSGKSVSSELVAEEPEVEELETEEAETEEACTDGLNKENRTSRKKSGQDDMLNRFGKPKRVYMFCYDDEEA